MTAVIVAVFAVYVGMAIYQLVHKGSIVTKEEFEENQKQIAAELAEVAKAVQSGDTTSVLVITYEKKSGRTGVFGGGDMRPGVVMALIGTMEATKVRILSDLNDRTPDAPLAGGKPATTDHH